MNQGIAFARTLRALDTDDFRASQLGLLVAAIVLGAWTWWMLAARVPQYETTTNVRIEGGRAIAYFPPDALRRVKPGQPAILRLDGSAFPAQVQTAAPDHAELVFANPQSLIPNPARPNPTAEIEVSRISPAALALNVLGRARR
jgi:hypothetical protein